MRSIFAENAAQGFYVNVEVNRMEATRYRLVVADIQTAVESGIGDRNIGENVEVSERHPVNVRYQKDLLRIRTVLRLLNSWVRNSRRACERYRSHLCCQRAERPR